MTLPQIANCSPRFFQTKLSHPHRNKFDFLLLFFGPLSIFDADHSRSATVRIRQVALLGRTKLRAQFMEGRPQRVHTQHKRTSTSREEGKGSPTFPFLCYSNHSCQTLEGRSSCRSCFCFKRPSKGGIVQLYGNGEAERASMGWPTHTQSSHRNKRKLMFEHVFAIKILITSTHST